MKIRAIALSFAIVCACSAPAFAGTPQKDAKPAASAPAPSGQPSQTDAPAETKIDPGKEAAIRKLIKLSGGMNSASQMMDAMQKNMRPMLLNAFPPGDYRDKLIDLFFEKFRSKMDMGVLENLTVRAYDKYFTEEEVNGLIQFYSTPMGQKMIVAMPKLMIELQTEGMKWGQDLGRQAMLEVMHEHPEFTQAMQDAAKKPRLSPQPPPQP